MSVYIDTRTDEEVMKDGIDAMRRLLMLFAANPKKIDTVDNSTEIDEDGTPFVIDTCSIADLKTYESAIKHEKYNDGQWIILGNYDNREEAARKHKIWTEYFKTNRPSFIEDAHTSVKYLRDAATE